MNAVTTTTPPQDNVFFSTIIATGAHDLRAPVCALHGLIHLAKEESDQKELHKYVVMMEGIVEGLDDNIRDILHFFRNHHLEVMISHIPLNELFTKTFENLKYFQEAKEIRYTVNVDEPVPFYSDQCRLKALVQNLHSNAIKYRRKDIPNPWVKATVTSDAEKATILFEDNGIGIPESKLDKVFDMFFRVRDRDDSSGLGLFIVKEIVTRLGGTISVESKINVGTRFTIVVPNRTDIL